MCVYTCPGGGIRAQGAPLGPRGAHKGPAHKRGVRVPGGSLGDALGGPWKALGGH